MTVGQDLTWQQSEGVLHGKKIVLTNATTPDMKTAIQIFGPPDAIRQVSVVGLIADEASAGQCAVYMALALRLILADWPGADAWLAASLRGARERTAEITIHGWKLHMVWLKKTSTITLKATR